MIETDMCHSLIARFVGPTWGRQDPGWPQVGAMNFAIWDYYYKLFGKNIFIITSRRIHHAYIFGLQCMIIPQTKRMTKRYTLYIADSMNSMWCCVDCGARPQWWTYVLNNLIQCRLQESCLIHPGCCWLLLFAILSRVLLLLTNLISGVVNTHAHSVNQCFIWVYLSSNSGC